MDRAQGHHIHMGSTCLPVPPSLPLLSLSLCLSCLPYSLTWERLTAPCFCASGVNSTHTVSSKPLARSATRGFPPFSLPLPLAALEALEAVLSKRQEVGTEAFAAVLAPVAAAAARRQTGKPPHHIFTAQCSPLLNNNVSPSSSSSLFSLGDDLRCLPIIFRN